MGQWHIHWGPSRLTMGTPDSPSQSCLKSARGESQHSSSRLADLGRGWGQEAASLLCNSDDNVLLGLFTICWAHTHFSMRSLINVLTTKPHQTWRPGVPEALVYRVSATAFLSKSKTFCHLSMACSAVGFNSLRQLFMSSTHFV